MNHSTRTQRVAAAIGLILACVLFGAAIGQMAVSLFVTAPGAETPGATGGVGNLIIGGVLGGLGGAYLATDLSVTARWWSAAVAVTLAMGTLWSIALAT